MDRVYWNKWRDLVAHLEFFRFRRRLLHGYLQNFRNLPELDRIFAFYLWKRTNIFIKKRVSFGGHYTYFQIKVLQIVCWKENQGVQVQVT